MSQPHLLPRSSTISRFHSVRTQTVGLTEGLTAEDMVIQSMPDTSPTKWHLAHTTWFFETFVLEPFSPDYRPFDPSFGYLFNSYYETVGKRHPRAHRGLVSRPALDRVLEYRQWVDTAIMGLVEDVEEEPWPEVLRRIRLGLHHEQQHQELMCMDVKHVLSSNPTFPSWPRANPYPAASELRPFRWIRFEGGVWQFGHSGESFGFDNEFPRHRRMVEDVELSDRLITNAEFQEFMEDGGYDRPELWLSDGWHWRQEHGVRAPLYWHQEQSDWFEYRVHGLAPVERAAPVVHVSYYEADAFARWRGVRLPTEFEWERAARQRAVEGQFLEDGCLHPRPAAPDPLDNQMYGTVWELTQSPYMAYPGFRPLEGALGEYNGKFMANQYVLRGGSCVTPQSHIRPTYRNYFYPHQRWAFQGFRLARDPVA